MGSEMCIRDSFQTGKFTEKDTHVVWMVLIGSSVGLLASTIGRLYSSTFFSLKDTKTTLYFAIVRIFFTTILGYLFAFKFAPMISSDPVYATAGLTASAGISGWIEFVLLQKKLNKIIGKTGVEYRYQSKLWGSALIASAIGLSIKFFIHLGLLEHPIPRAVIILGVYGVLYFGITYMIGIEESRAIINKIKSKVLRS